MTLAARLAWVGVAAGLIVAGFVIASLHRERSAAADELGTVAARQQRLEQRAERLDQRVSDLLEEREDHGDLREDCYLEVVGGIEDWSQLLADIRRLITNPSELDSFVERSEDLLVEAREVLATCSEV